MVKYGKKYGLYGMAERFKLKASQIGKAKKPGLQNDGGGLYLSTSKTLTQSWIFRYRRHGKLRDVGLGSTRDVTLSDARDLAEKARRAAKEGKDPRVAIKSQGGPITFRDAANAYIEAHSPGWRNAKHKQQWENTLSAYAHPVIGDLSVAEIETDHILAILTPIWYSKTETASRVRMRIENILAWAKAKGYREGFNPAIWGGHLNQLLPAREKVQRREHFAAMPYEELPELYDRLRKSSSTGAAALRFAILTACRTNEVIGARWEELADDMWTIPSSRIKAGREHRVPLSAEAIDVLDGLEESSDFVFPGGSGGHISNMTMAKLLKSYYPGVTVHGMRSTFRDWAAETTSYQNHIAEMALAHKVSNAVEAAYRRGDLIAKRRELMSEWAQFVAGGQR